MPAQVTLETVISPVTSFADLSADIDTLAAIQKQAAGLEQTARQLRAHLREGMARTGLDAFVSANGHRASLFTSITTKADREMAERILSADQMALVFRPTTSVILRVK